MSYLAEMISKLPDAYAKDPDSNNYKLFACIAPEFEEIAEMFQDVASVLDMDNAYGASLDRIAANVNQSRGQVKDTTLRTLIKAKIASDMSAGTIKTMLDVIGFIVGTGAKVRITEMFNDADTPEAAAMGVSVPLENVIESGLTLNHFVNLLSRVRAAGVRITTDIQGTFEFGEIGEYGGEYETGFADEEQTVGGTLGALFDSDSDEPLPI